MESRPSGPPPAPDGTRAPGAPRPIAVSARACWRATHEVVLAVAASEALRLDANEVTVHVCYAHDHDPRGRHRVVMWHEVCRKSSDTVGQLDADFCTGFLSRIGRHGWSIGVCADNGRFWEEVGE